MKNATLAILIVFLIPGIYAQNETNSADASIEHLQKELEHQKLVNQSQNIRIKSLEQSLKRLENIPEIKIPRLIKSNLHLLESALQIYCVEQGVTECSYSDIVGPETLIPNLIVFDGENYKDLNFDLSETRWSVETNSNFIIFIDLAPVRLKELMQSQQGSADN